MGRDSHGISPGGGAASAASNSARPSYAIVQTITFSLYLYSAEIYPTRLHAIGTGLGSAWLRLGSTVGPMLTGWTIAYAGDFVVFAVVLLIGALVTIFFAVETKGRVLEELSS